MFTNYYSVYREWVVCYLDALLEIDQPDFWFDNIKEGISTPSILEQFEASCTRGKGDIVCPRCNVELGRFASWEYVYDMITSGKCPICDCDLDKKRGERDWCDLCKVPCEERIELEKQWNDETHLCHEADVRRQYG